MTAAGDDPNPSLRMVRVPGKGRGVVAGRAFSAGEVVDLTPVVVVPARQRDLLDRTELRRFCFSWDDDTGSLAVALGRASLFNHSYQPTVRTEKRVGARTIVFLAERDIRPGEELTINYNGDPDCRDPMWFDVREG